MTHLVDEPQYTVAVLDRVVPVEAQLGGVAESHLLSQLGTQEASSGVQHLQHPGLLLLAADTADEDLSVFEVGSRHHLSNSDELIESGVSQVMLNEVANFTTDERIDAFDTM